MGARVVVAVVAGPTPSTQHVIAPLALTGSYATVFTVGAILVLVHRVFPPFSYSHDTPMLHVVKPAGAYDMKLIHIVPSQAQRPATQMKVTM